MARLNPELDCLSCLFLAFFTQSATKGQRASELRRSTVRCSALAEALDTTGSLGQRCHVHANFTLICP